MVLTAHLSQDRTLRLGCLPVLLSGLPPPAPLPEGTVLSPKPASSYTLVPSPAQAVLTSSQVPRDEAEEDADDVTQVRSAAVLALLQPQGRVPSWARGLPTPRHPWPWPRGPSVCPAPQPLCPPLPSLKALSLYSRALSPTSGLSPDLSASPAVSVAPLCLSLSALPCPPLSSVFTSLALGLSQDRLPPSPALHLAPDPGSSGPGCPLSLETEGLLQLPGLGGCEGGVGCVPEFHHHWGRCPCVIFN